MKNKVYQISIVLSIIALFIAPAKTIAQVTIYNENFDNATMVFPTGWSADTANGGWKVDSTNVDTIPGSSGHQNMAISNATGRAGVYKLYSKNISTVGYGNITVLWDARLTKHFRDSGSTIDSFDFSTDGGSTWTNVPYTENPSNTNSFWYADNGGSRINFPAGVNNQPTVVFRWVATLVSTSSGTYRIDDFNVQGTIANGIRTYKIEDLFRIYVDCGKLLHLEAKPSYSLPSASLITISDVTGKVCFNADIKKNENIYYLSFLKQGIYFVRITTSGLQLTQKIICE